MTLIVRIVTFALLAMSPAACVWLLVGNTIPPVREEPMAAAGAAECGGTQLTARGKPVPRGLDLGSEPGGRIIGSAGDPFGGLSEIVEVDVADGSVRRLVEAYRIDQLTPSPDESLIAYTIEPDDPLYSGPILVLGDPTGEQREVFVSEGFVTGLTWSPASDELAFISDGALWAADPSTFEIRRITDAPSALPLASSQQAAWSPRGDWIAFDVGWTRTVWLVRPDGSERHAFVSATNFAWSPDGEYLAFSNRGVSIVRPDGTDLRHLAATPPGTALWWVGWAPDGGAIAYTGGDGVQNGALCVLSLSGGVAEIASCVAVESVAWSPDGEWVGYSAAIGPGKCDERPRLKLVAADMSGGRTVDIPAPSLCATGAR